MNLPSSHSPQVSRSVYLHPQAANRALFQLHTCYVETKGERLLQMLSELEGSDLFSTIYRRSSADNGCTWSPIEPVYQPSPLPNGNSSRQGEMALFLSERTGRLYRFFNFHREVEPHFSGKVWWNTELMFQWSDDKATTFSPPIPVLQGEESADADPAFSPVVISFSRPFHLSNGTIVLPVQKARPISDDPLGRLEWWAGCLLGREEQNGIRWRRGGFINLDLACSTRGAFEPAIANLGNGRLLMICRASNTGNLALPSHKWLSISDDEGQSWTPLRPWTFENGNAFFSPSSGSSLHRHSNGKLYWFGNISPENARANSPRFPLYCGLVDEATLCLNSQSLFLIDTRSESEPEALQLSNFRLYEDRKTGEIVLHLARLFELGKGTYYTPSYEYRLLP